MNARGHLSSETIDLLLMAALTGEKESTARAHLDGCQLCQKRWAELNEDKARFEQYVFPRTVGKLEERLSKQSIFDRFNFRFLIPVVGSALAASIALSVYLGGKDRTQTEDDVYIGVKGGASLEVVANRAETGQFPVRPGTVLKPKDRIRFVVNTAGAKYVMIASRDGAGAFSVYYPYGSAQSGEVTPGHVELPKSIELDETTGNERIVAVFSQEPVEASAVKAAIDANPGDPKVDKAKVVSWEFVKAK
jgi:hypothetical protein